MQNKRPKGKLIAAEPNELVEMVLFQLGEHTGKIKGRGRPRTKGAKDVADLYVIAIANIEKTSTGVYSYMEPRSGGISPFRGL